MRTPKLSILNIVFYLYDLAKKETSLRMQGITNSRKQTMQIL